MKTNTLQKYYRIFESFKNTVRKEITILGHKITLVCWMTIDNGFNTDYQLEDIEIPKESIKFFNEFENIVGRSLDSTEYIYDCCYDLTREVDKKLKDLMKLAYKERVAIYNCFFAGEVLRSFDEVKKLYAQKDVSPVIKEVRLSSDYKAIIQKDQPIQVGCQRIPIETVKKIVEEYESLNK